MAAVVSPENPYITNVPFSTIEASGGGECFSPHKRYWCRERFKKVGLLAAKNQKTGEAVPTRTQFLSLVAIVATAIIGSESGRLVVHLACPSMVRISASSC